MHVFPNTAEASCVGASCSTHGKAQEMTTEEDPSKLEDLSVTLDNKIQRDERMDVANDGQKRGKGRETADEKREEKDQGSEEERVPPASRPHNQPGSPQPVEGMDYSGIP